MIIFDLCGCLAENQYIKNFIYFEGTWKWLEDEQIYLHESGIKRKNIHDWQAFYESTSEDKPIIPVIELWNQQISLGCMDIHQIWTGRCESLRDKTEVWLDKHLLCFNKNQLKMRPIGDNTPRYLLKEKWLKEHVDSMWPELEPAQDKEYRRKDPIEFVFDSDPESIKMWKLKGIFVFNCSQNYNG